MGDWSRIALTLALSARKPIVTHKFSLNTAGGGYTTDSCQLLKTRRVLGYPSLEKRGQGRFFAITWLIVPQNSQTVTKKTSPPHNQIPLDPPFPKGEWIAGSHRHSHSMCSKQVVAHDRLRERVSELVRGECSLFHGRDSAFSSGALSRKSSGRPMNSFGIGLRLARSFMTVSMPLSGTYGVDLNNLA